ADHAGFLEPPDPPPAGGLRQPDLFGQHRHRAVAFLQQVEDLAVHLIETGVLARAAARIAHSPCGGFHDATNSRMTPEVSAGATQKPPGRSWVATPPAATAARAAERSRTATRIAANA